MQTNTCVTPMLISLIGKDFKWSLWDYKFQISSLPLILQKKKKKTYCHFPHFCSCDCFSYYSHEIKKKEEEIASNNCIH